MKKNKITWITRDSSSGHSNLIWFDDIKPRMLQGNADDKVECKAEIHKTEFKALFGFTPRKGSCKQYELTLKEIK